MNLFLAFNSSSSWNIYGSITATIAWNSITATIASNSITATIASIASITTAIASNSSFYRKSHLPKTMFYVRPSSPAQRISKFLQKGPAFPEYFHSYRYVLTNKALQSWFSVLHKPPASPKNLHIWSICGHFTASC